MIKSEETYCKNVQTNCKSSMGGGGDPLHAKFQGNFYYFFGLKSTSKHPKSAKIMNVKI